MNRTTIATTEADVARLLEKEGFTVRLFESPAALAAESEPGQLAVLGSAPADVFEQLHARVVPVPALAVAEDVSAMLVAGADAAVRPPLEAASLKAWVTVLLRLRRRFEMLAERQRELEDLSRKDGLTGLFNHRWLKERLGEEFRRAQRHADALALLMIDLDEFKLVNDRRGHPFGDRMLRAVSDLITRSVRETDLCARYGGEEFAVLLPRSGLNGALTVAERIWSGAHEVSLEGEQVSLSVGVAVGPSPQLRSPELLLRSADEALYRAKREGRNRICIDPQTQLRAREATALG